MVDKNWFEDEELWRTFGDCMFSPDSFRAAAEQVTDLLTLLQFEPQRVLDLACGPGRHAIPLAAHGVEVSAVDLSPYLLDQARLGAAEAKVEVEWVQADMRQFERVGGYDAVICMWTSFGYFDDPEDDLRVLQHCYRNLADQGALVIDVVGKEYVVRNLQPVHLTEYDDGSLLVERPLLECAMSRISNQWILIRDGQAQTTQWQHNLYSGRELHDRLLQAGFERVDLYGSLRGEDYDLESERLIAVARKGKDVTT